MSLSYVRRQYNVMPAEAAIQSHALGSEPAPASSTGHSSAGMTRCQLTGSVFMKWTSQSDHADWNWQFAQARHIGALKCQRTNLLWTDVASSRLVHVMSSWEVSAAGWVSGPTCFSPTSADEHWLVDRLSGVKQQYYVAMAQACQAATCQRQDVRRTRGACNGDVQG